MTTTLKPPPDRLYGRSKGKKLRARQEWLLAEFLPQVSWPEIPFGNAPRELWLEVGFGGGEHAFELAGQNSDVGYIAAEVFENGICSLLSKIAPDGVEAPAVPANLRLYTDDARPLLKSFAEGALSRLFLMFPDPWPKARHTKRRFVHPEIVAEAARAIRTGGQWRIASDDPTYQDWTDEVLTGQNFFDVKRETEHPEGWPHTRYEAKAIAAGRVPVYWTLTRR
ncbi:tRNA (guanosine(46)-N(7))-methyltransferase TrmB [Acidocella sp.]|uniref:tRNA (guanine(46)-N(7))-methyltransferase TrmB n=1 Tax=Acidocella sp. TaxID=50710 RepID=UPI0026068337|nr:tRNA (guanine(46)-N(7))-methyltransferase TrmB [Acidocella sp.]